MPVLNREMLGGKLCFTYLPQTMELWLSTPLSVLTDLGILDISGQEEARKDERRGHCRPRLFSFCVPCFRLDHCLKDVRLYSNPYYCTPPIDTLTRRFNWRPSAVSLLASGTTGPYHTVTSRFSAIALIFASAAEKISFSIK